MALTESDVLAALNGVMDPELHRSIVDLGMVRELTVSPEGVVAFTLTLTVPACPLRDRMQNDARRALESLPGVTSVEIGFGQMNADERRSLFGEPAPAPRLGGFNRIGRVVAVMSGKGGVGKSSVTALLACALARQGKKVGVMDADVTGPSIPKLFGLPAGGLRGNELGILPAHGPLGIRVVSTNLLLPSDDAALTWRGPMVTATIKQFWEQVLWGKLDYLLVDLPPGTGDAALSVVQILPLDGAILVTSPQGLAALVVRKAVHMLQSMNIPILGVIENMSAFVCPDDARRHEIFGPSHAGEVAEAAGVEVWASLPITTELAALSDEGRIADVTLPEIDAVAARLPDSIAARV